MSAYGVRLALVLVQSSHYVLHLTNSTGRHTVVVVLYFPVNEENVLLSFDELVRLAFFRVGELSVLN